jgi:hypothetical protein
MKTAWAFEVHNGGEIFGQVIAYGILKKGCFVELDNGY